MFKPRKIKEKFIFCLTKGSDSNIMWYVSNYANLPTRRCIAHEDDIPAEEDLSRQSSRFSFENEHC